MKILYTLVLLPLFFPVATITNDPLPPIDPIVEKAEKISLTIKKVESGGRYEVKGASGEIGAYQMLPSTYKNLSIIHLGTSTPMTPENQDLIVRKEVERLLREGYTLREIALVWNQGHRGQCRAGTNKHGVKYDSCAYAQKILRTYDML